MKNTIAVLAIVSLMLLASCGTKDVTKTVEKTTQNVAKTTETVVEDTMEKADETMEKATETVEEVMEKTDDAMEKVEEVMEKESDTSAVMAGSYAPYSEDMLAKTDNTVLFFHASWCPGCRATDEALSGETIPDDLTVLKLDFDNSGELRKKYGVTGQHTFVQVDADGNEVAKWRGSKNSADIVAQLK